jgi:tetratricopeptide (TPR) repeat protein
MNQTATTPNPPEPFEQENRRAEDLILANDITGAARILVSITEKDHANFRAFNNMGLVAWHNKSWEDAWVMFSTAVSLKPDFHDALVNLFDTALKLRRIPAALPLFEKALAMNPALEEIRIIANSIRQQGDGIYESERGLLIGTYNPRIEDANRLLDERKMFAAMEKYLNVLDDEGPNAEAFSGLGIISYYQKRYDDAYSLFLQSIKCNPTSRENFLNLLDAAKSCGKEADARMVYNGYRERFSALEGIAAEFKTA